MIAGVVSDTHGSMGNLKRALELIGTNSPDMIIHLGDDYEDILRIKDINMKIVTVPGVYSSYYKDHAVPNRIILEMSGLRVLVSHTDVSHPNDMPDDLRPEELIEGKKINILLHGHSHKPRIETIGDIIYFNPGHLKDGDERGFPPTFGIMDFKERILQIRKLYDNSEFLKSRF